LNVICVDDSRLVLLSLRRKTGLIVPEARVFTCRSAKQAAETARKNGCDVLLTDIDIGGSETGGLDLARQIREINPNVNIIFVTVSPEWEYARDVRIRARTEASVSPASRTSLYWGSMRSRAAPAA